MTETHTFSKSAVIFCAATLCVYCLVLAIVAGNIGFEGDDWWVFSWPYWNAFPSSLWYFARDCLRPVEGVYWISLFEVFGLNRVAFHLASLLLALGGCACMGLSLADAFPHPRAFAGVAVFFAFFMPTVSPLTYVLATDNSRLSLFLFWACVLAYQRWAAGLASWRGLFGPWLLYALAFCTYEAPSFLLFSVPLFVWPVWDRGCRPVSSSSFAIRLAAGIFGSFASVIAIRFLVLQGGAVSQSSLLPSWELLWAYPALVPFYLLAPFMEAHAQVVALLAGVIVALMLGSVLIVSFGRKRDCVECAEAAVEKPAYQRGWYVAGLGLSVLILGFLPYQLAGYGAPTPRIAETALIKWGVIPDGLPYWFNFNWSSRIYSAGSYGLAILLAWSVTAWTGRQAKVVAGCMAAVWIGFMASFHMGLSRDWREAARMRNALIASLVSQVPDVTPGTNFLFVDLESSWGRAPVFRNWNGLRELVRMIYSRNDLGAWYVFPYRWKPPNRMFHQAIATQAGFVSRAMDPNRPAGLDSLIILSRSGSHLDMVDRISAGDDLVPTGINWDGVDSLSSHMDRIRGWREYPAGERKPIRNAWQSGLMSSVELWRIPVSGAVHNGWGSQESIGRPIGVFHGPPIPENSQRMRLPLVAGSHSRK